MNRHAFRFHAASTACFAMLPASCGCPSGTTTTTIDVSIVGDIADIDTIEMTTPGGEVVTCDFEAGPTTRGCDNPGDVGPNDPDEGPYRVDVFLLDGRTVTETVTMNADGCGYLGSQTLLLDLDADPLVLLPWTPDDGS